VHRPLQRTPLRQDLLNREVTSILLQLRNRKIHHWHMFERRVDHTAVPDYSYWVPPGDEICLNNIRRRAAMHGNASMEEFMSDVRLIRSNALNYHTPGHGAFADPVAVLAARILEEEVEWQHAAIAGGGGGTSGDGLAQGVAGDDPIE